MHIGIDIRNIGKKRTGDEVVFFNLVKHLALIDSINEYSLFTDITDTTILHSIVVKLGVELKNNFKIISLPCSNKFVWNFWTLPKYLRRNPVDIYQTQYITPFFVPKKVKIITIIHDISFNFFPRLIKLLDLIFLKIFIPISLKRAEKILTVSQFTRDEIINYYHIPNEKIDFFYNSISDNFSKLATDQEMALAEKKYNLPEKFIFYIGTMQLRKNLFFLIEAFAKIKNRLPGVKLVLAGNKGAHNYDSQIDMVIKKYSLKNEVIFPGFIDEQDKSAVFRKAQLFCFPSLYEGFGIPLLEAMSQEVPVLASDIPSLREVAEKGALFFNPKQVADLSEKIYNIYNDENLRNALRQSGRDRLLFFSWETAAEKILNIYNNLIKK